MILACSAWLALACVAGGTSPAPAAMYGAALTGAREVPAAVTPATGTAGFLLTGTIVTYTVTTTGFSSPLTVGHVHLGGVGETGPVIVPFSIMAQSGIVATGVVDVGVPVTFGNITISGDSLLHLFENGKAYVNLHTAGFPGGEIRGQVVRK
ncbi:hypothetical protein BH11GEM1_BH11GEM1_30470 [soil metagenome]